MPPAFLIPTLKNGMKLFVWFLGVKILYKSVDPAKKNGVFMLKNGNFGKNLNLGQNKQIRSKTTK